MSVSQKTNITEISMMDVQLDLNVNSKYLENLLNLIKLNLLNYSLFVLITEVFPVNISLLAYMKRHC